MSRISPGTLTVGIIAVLIALAGTYALRVYLEPQPEPAAQVETPPERTVPVASLDLPTGRTIQLGDIALRLRSDVDTIKPNTMSDTNYIIGRVLKKPLTVGETFATTDLYPQGEGPELTDRLRPGFRAVTVPVANFDAVAGYVAAGTMVDVLFRSTPQEGQDGREEIPEVTMTLAESVEVLAVGQNPHAPGTDDAARRDTSVLVTIACRHDEANKLRAIEGRGDIALALRAKDDVSDHSTIRAVGLTEVKRPVSSAATTEVATPGITLKEILGVKAEPEPYRMEVYRGSQRSINVFGKDRFLVGQPNRNDDTNTSKDAQPQ